MIGLRGPSINARLKLVIVLTSSASLILCCLGFIGYEYTTIRERMGNSLINMAIIVGANCTAALSFENREDAAKVLSSLRTRLTIREAAVYDQHGRIFATYVKEGETARFPTTVSPDGWKYTESSIRTFSPIEFEGTRIGTIYLRSDLSILDERLRTYGAIAAVVLMLSVIASILIASVVQKKISGPILDLAHTARVVSEQKDYSIRSEGGGPGELKLLGSAFNDMLEQIQQHDAELQKMNNALAEEIQGRKQIESHLRQSEQRYRTLFDLVPAGIYACDNSSNILEYNQRALELWSGAGHANGGGASPAGAYKQFAKDGSLIPVHQDPTARVLRGDHPSAIDPEIVIERQDGSRRTVLVTPRPLKNEAGEITGVLSCLHDITERKMAEEELRKAHDSLELRVLERTRELAETNEKLRKRELQLSTAQEIAHLGSWEWDIGTGALSYSDELYRIYGLEPEAITPTSETFFTPIHPEDREEKISLISEALSTGQPFEHEERIIRPDGSVRVLLTGGRGDFADGRLVRLVGVALDVTERRRAEQRFEDLLESAPDPMVITNSDGDVLLVNMQTEHVFGHLRSELLEANIESLIPGFLDPDRRLRSFKAGTLEFQAKRSDGISFPVHVNASPLDTQEGILILSIRDITEQRRLQLQLGEAERQRLEYMERYALSIQRAQEEERGRIARDLHDGICQKLCGMKMTAEGVEELSKENRALHRKVRGLSRQCEDLIGEVRRMSANLRPSLLDDFGIDAALRFLARQFEKQQKIKVDLDLDTSAAALKEPQVEIALYRISQEALANIGRHSGASHAFLSLRRNPGEMVMQVGDDGKGFNPEDVARGRDAEHGLGLVNMRERAELLGGTFTVESGNQGTVISVTLPCSTPDGRPELVNEHPEKA